MSTLKFHNKYFHLLLKKKKVPSCVKNVMLLGGLVISI